MSHDVRLGSCSTDAARQGTLKRRTVLIGASAAAMSLLAPACARAEQISVTHWGALMYGAPYAVGLAKGFFREAGVNIDGILTSHGVATAADILWVVKLDSPVRSIQQLAGNKVACTGPKSVTDMLLW